MAAAEVVPVDRASALVVGLERYPGLGAKADPHGAALSAARFALWLLEIGACPPERLTLMIAFDPADYAGEPCSPDEVLTAIRSFNHGAGAAVNVQRRADAATDFYQAWMNNARYRPKRDDDYFYLFWAGHGFTYPYFNDSRLCLLGTDATGGRLNHVELFDLLKVVGDVAPQAHEVVFANACRAHVPLDWLDRLKAGWQQMALPDGESRAAEDSSPFALSIVYAAALGLTTKQTGRSDETLADTLLDMAGSLRQEQLPLEGKPLALFNVFGPELNEIGSTGRWVTSKENASVFYYSYGPHTAWYPPIREGQLTQDEWTSLLRIVRAIDVGQGGRPLVAWPALWGALCEASGVRRNPAAITGQPGRLNSLEDLVTILHDRPPIDNAPVPLLVACDYVANLPQPGSYPRLAKWCENWADKRRNGWLVLKAVREQRPARQPDECYVSILVDPEDPAPGRPVWRGKDIVSRYTLRALLWGYGGPHVIHDTDLVSEDKIVQAATELIKQAKSRVQGVPRQWRHTIVEFVVPRNLLGRRLEYEGSYPLGYQYPVVIRDLERLHPAGISNSAEWADETLRRMAAFQPDGQATWSGQVEWVKCDDPDRDQAIVRAIRETGVFCLALEHGSNGSPLGAGAALPGELELSVETGAAIVLSVHHVNTSCSLCAYREKTAMVNGAHSCAIAMILREEFRKQLGDQINKLGLWDLPTILSDTRPWLSSKGIMVGVLIEDNSRLWAGLEALASGAATSGS
jgi:hypothetical protein